MLKSEDFACCPSCSCLVEKNPNGRCPECSAVHERLVGDPEDSRRENLAALFAETGKKHPAGGPGADAGPGLSPVLVGGVAFVAFLAMNGAPLGDGAAMARWITEGGFIYLIGAVVLAKLSSSMLVR